MTMFTLPEGVSVDDFDEYESGCIDQHARCEREARIIMFGAIRRAATVARKHDARAEKYLATIFEHVSAGRFRDDDYLVDIEMSANNAWHCQSCARAIRDAIRAALGSEKA